MKKPPHHYIYKEMNRLESNKTNNTFKNTARFDEKELQQWYRGFQKDCPNGFLDKKDFERIYKDYFPFGDATKYAHYVFRHLDINQTGKIGFEEFIRVRLGAWSFLILLLVPPSCMFLMIGVGYIRKRDNGRKAGLVF